jgi:NAD(P)-dependent dehydrogenase (short-subunit alcohol dehydrogenase family)
VSIPNFLLAGEVAIVTGSRRGIGKTIALAFAEAGANVAVCDLIVEDGELQAVADEIQKLGRRSLAIQTDTSKKRDVENLVQKVVDQFGGIDILINNAGIIIKSPLLDIPEDDWDKLMSVDLKGYYLCSQAAGRRMVERKKGKIINVASQYAFKVTPGMGVYSIAKAGVVMLTRALAQELGSYGIRANAIAPCLVKTEFSRPSWSDPEFLKQCEASIPLGRVAETTDLVGAALFLASEASCYITGHTILVDGGTLA